MRPAKAAFILLLAAALLGSCDRASRGSPPAPAPAASAATPIEAADPACALPLERFARSRMQLTGTRLDYPTNLVLIDRTGRLRWNGQSVEPQRLRDYVEHQANTEPAPILAIEPDPDAPCAVVRETLATAIEVGRCTPKRCAFQWPGTDAPPLLPERSKLLGSWLLVSIDGSGPPPGAPPIEVIFTDGEVGARSQCVSFAWLYAVEEGRLRMRVPNRLVAMCARGLSPWEKRFEAAMPAAAYIESDGEQLIVTGPTGKLILKRPD